MTEFIKIYRKDQEIIDNFLVSTLQRLDYRGTSYAELKGYFKIFPSLELIYVVDKQYNQVSPNIRRHKEDSGQINCNRRYLLEKRTQTFGNITISHPYISTTSRSLCVTLTKEDTDGKIIFFDFKLDELLRRLQLVESNIVLDNISKYSYGAIGLGLMITALFLSLYALFLFGKIVFFTEGYILDNIFKSIISLTLGLAIFDLAKTILENELFFKSFKEETLQGKQILGKFLTSIIIALSIESLMVVFKIALNNYREMENAFYLIGGVSLLILALSIFNYLGNKNRVGD